MFGVSREGGRGSLLMGTIKSVVAVGLLSWLAGVWLSATSRDHETLSRLATNVSQGVDDPLTTGSIGGRARSTRLDPCSVPKR